MIKELIGWVSPDLTDEEFVALINEIEAEEDARLEFEDHAMNSEV